MTDSHAKKEHAISNKKCQTEKLCPDFHRMQLFCVIPAVYAAGMNICNEKAGNIQLK